MGLAISVGAAIAGLAIGYLIGSRRAARPGASATVYPVSHVSFEVALSDADRLRLLEEAAQAVRDGRLRKAENLGDDASGNKCK